MKTIVIAWTETETVVAKERRIDLGERHTFREVTIAKAVVWVNEGTADDLARATGYANRENAEQDWNGTYLTRGETAEKMRVFIYPTTEKDPLGRAKKDVLRK